jgi:hypothetical protein
MTEGNMRLPAALIAMAALLVTAGCNGGNRGGGGSPEVPAKADESALLRFKYEKGQLLRYDTRFRMRSSGTNRIDDRVHSVIYVHCLGPAGPGEDPEFFKVNITRKEVERKRTARDSSGREMPPIIATRTSVPVITPNYGYDRRRNKNYFPINTRGMFGLSKKVPFHRVTYDSLVYLLPVLPPTEVRGGSTWTVEIPVYAGPDYIYPAGGYRRGNEFKLRFSGRIVRLYYRAGERCAVMSWTADGTFDTQAFSERFPPAFHNRQRLIHEVKASGEAVFNATRGALVSRNGQATVTFTSRVLLSKRDRSGKVAGHEWEEDANRTMIHYQSQLMEEKESDPRPRTRTR